MPCWTQNTIPRTSCITVSSIWTHFRCFHANTWASKASVTRLTITLSWHVSVCAISTQDIRWQSISRAMSSFGAWMTLNAPNCSKCTSWTLDWICFIFTTKTIRLDFGPKFRSYYNYHNWSQNAHLNTNVSFMLYFNSKLIENAINSTECKMASYEIILLESSSFSKTCDAVSVRK